MQVGTKAYSIFDKAISKVIVTDYNYIQAL